MITFKPIYKETKFGNETIKICREVKIISEGKEVGRIFSPSSSGQDVKNAIQVCGFTEAFDLWGCGVYDGFKDIQLLFDEGIMGGVVNSDLDHCIRCYRYPCQCENKDKGQMPFNVKRQHDIEDRLKLKKVCGH